MELFFNTEGPCEPSRHYMLPPTARLPTIRQAIARGKYLVLHAPRQVGKTTALLALARELSASGRFERAREAVILRRETHLDSLVERLREPRVRRLIAPLLVGALPAADVMSDDLAYCRDLGILAPDAPVRIANPIYREVIPRALSFQVQEYLDQRAQWYEKDDRSLDMVLLLAAFQEFFAEHSESWVRRFDYLEAGPHLLLMAFLQRVVNGGGRAHADPADSGVRGDIRREFAVGSGRADLVVEFAGKRSVLEVKLHRGRATEAEGEAQLCGYLDRLGESEGYLILFDRRKGRSWADKLYIKETEGPAGQRLFVFGM